MIKETPQLLQNMDIHIIKNILGNKLYKEIDKIIKNHTLKPMVTGVLLNYNDTQIADYINTGKKIQH